MSNLAFHNDPQLAAQIVAQINAHASADEIVQGIYWENGKGCFIGCIAHENNPKRVEELTGLPVMLTRIAESIFEGLPNASAKTFPVRVTGALAANVGADLSLVSWKFLHWLIEDVLREHGTDAVRASCSDALEVVARKARGEKVAAAYAGYAARAARDASDVATTAVAAYAAYAASVTDDAYAAYAAAHAAAYAALAARASDAARARQADKLIELLKEAPRSDGAKQ